MTRKAKQRVIRQIVLVLSKYRNYPPQLLAERIYIDAFEKALDSQRDIYERLILTDYEREV